MAEEIKEEYLRDFGSLELLARQVVEGFITGLHKSPYHGFSVEFAEHRLYNTGESTRHIDWKLYARTDKLFVKRYEEETNLRCYLVLDQSSSMFFPVRKKLNIEEPNKIQFSIYAAAALMNILKRQRDAVGLALFDSELRTITPARTTTRHHKLLYHELEQQLTAFDASQRRETFAVQALHEIAEKVHQRSMIVLFSDMFDTSPEGQDELFQALQHLKYNKHEVLLFHVVDRAAEIEFDFENRPYKFVDMESGEEIKVQAGEIQEEYVKKITALEKELELRCAQYHIDFIPADINLGFQQVLLPYLLKRQRLY